MLSYLFKSGMTARFLTLVEDIVTSLAPHKEHSCPGDLITIFFHPETLIKDPYKNWPRRYQETRVYLNGDLAHF